MPSPFPGFDPYLETPSLWRGVHNLLISNITAELNKLLPPGFDANIEERVYLIQPEKDLLPDILLTVAEPKNPPVASGTATLVEDPPFRLTLLEEEIYESYVEVRLLGDTDQVVTVIEILSPTNKTADGRGRDSYVRKQEEILRSDVHLLEIDLLREGMHAVAVPRDALRQRGVAWDYLVCLHRGGKGQDFEYWPISVRTRLPRVRVPLSDGYSDVILNLQVCFERAYDAGPYRRRVDYRREPLPPLSPADAAWADTLLREKGVR